MAKDFAEHMQESRRYWVLRFLSEANGYALNDAILLDLIRGRGHVASTDTLRADLAWLEEQGLLTVEDYGEVSVATLKRRGLDVAQGVALVPGVRRPAPEL